MKLTRNETIRTYQVQANFRKKEKSAPFVGILTYIDEQKAVTSYELHEDFLGKTLTPVACENLLNRLKAIGLLETEWDIFYLTKAGKESVTNQEIYLPQTGLMNISICESALIPQQVVKIEILMNNKGLEKMSDGRKRKFDKVKTGETIDVKNGSYIFDSFEDVWTEITNGKQNAILTVNCEKNVQILLLDYDKEWEKASPHEVRQSILAKTWGKDYIAKKDTLMMKFDPKDLSFQRNIRVEKPNWEGISFDDVNIENVNINAKTIEEAHLWRNELLIKKIRQHIFSETQFQKYDEEERKKFESFHTLSLHSRASFIQEINKKKENFYVVAKIETCQILHY